MFLKKEDFEISQSLSGYGKWNYSFVLPQTAYDESGSKIDVTITVKSEHADFDIAIKNKLSTHVFAFDKMPFDKNGNSLSTILQRAHGAAGKQTSFFNLAKFPNQVSYKPHNYATILFEEWVNWIRVEFAKLFLEGKVPQASVDFSLLNVAIFGLGGTGSYVAEHISNLTVGSLSLVDFDKLEQKNLYRFALSPQPSNVGDLKVEFIKNRIGFKFAGERKLNIYSESVEKFIERGINDFDFVFICLDDNKARASAISYCKQNNIPFIDVGIWVGTTGSGKLKFTTRTSMVDDTAELESSENHVYKTNAQISEINSANANDAIILFKQCVQFYAQHEEKKFKKVTRNQEFEFTNEKTL